ncbi:hypothetical protein FHG87_020741 [Trinorchestia longiramus]|nr:hypothetical protein FHG87_020741 [Trinorchestia longiramus]
MKCSVETRRAPKQQRPDIRRQKWFLRNRSEVLEDGLLPYNPSSLVAASAAGTRTPHHLSDRRSHMDHHLRQRETTFRNWPGERNSSTKPFYTCSSPVWQQRVVQLLLFS